MIIYIQMYIIIYIKLHRNCSLFGDLTPFPGIGVSPPCSSNALCAPRAVSQGFLFRFAVCFCPASSENGNRASGSPVLQPPVRWQPDPTMGLSAEISLLFAVAGSLCWYSWQHFHFTLADPSRIKRFILDFFLFNFLKFYFIVFALSVPLHASC